MDFAASSAALRQEYTVSVVPLCRIDVSRVRSPLCALASYSGPLTAIPLSTKPFSAICDRLREELSVNSEGPTIDFCFWFLMNLVSCTELYTIVVSEMALNPDGATTESP